MKRKMISVLALALILLMSVVLVSCEDMLPVAPENVVAAVVYESKMDFGIFDPYIAALINQTKTPTILEADIKADLNTRYSVTTATAQVDSKTISASAAGDKLSTSVLFSNLRFESSSYKGDFTLEDTFLYDAATHTMKVKGSFVDDTITFSSVNFGGTDYDVDAFNRAIN